MIEGIRNLPLASYDEFQSDARTPAAAESHLRRALEALLDLGKRTDDEDLDIFITTLLIHLQVGGDLSEILDTISETIRERVKLKGDIRTMTAQSQMSAVVIGILPVAIAAVMFVLNPSYIRSLFLDPLGLMMVGVATGMMLLGAFLLTRIVKVKI
jgi:tight adherence protein B